MTHTKQQIVNAMAQGVEDLFAPTDDVITDDAKANDLKILFAPPQVGSTVTSQALNKWLTQAIHNAPGVSFSTADLASSTRVVAFLRDPICLRQFLREELGIDLVQPPILDLPLTEDGKIDNSPETLKTAVLAAVLEFYGDAIDDSTDFEGMASELVVLYDSGVLKHPLIEVFQYWGLVPTETLFPWVLQYFHCVQTEESVAAQIKTQQEKSRKDAAEALEHAATSAASGGTMSTVSKVATVPQAS